MSQQKLVIDANAFLQAMVDLQNLSSHYSLYTTPSVLAELKDHSTRQKLQAFLPKFSVKEPTPGAQAFVQNFAKKTGDFISLSRPDIGVIALAFDLVSAEGQASLLRKSPLKCSNKTSGSKEEARRHQEGLGWAQGDLVSDDEKGWVGPSNLGDFKAEVKRDLLLEEDPSGAPAIKVAVITSDFAMQNQLLQIGIPLVNLEGKVISKVKSFVLECFSCWAISRKPDIVFCKKCGKNTLLKVTCEFLDNGEFILYRKRNKQIKTSGARFDIPQPKGGRQIEDVLLYEDDFMKPKVQSYLRRFEKDQQRQEKILVENVEQGFGIDGVISQKQKLKNLNVGTKRNVHKRKPAKKSK